MGSHLSGSGLPICFPAGRKRRSRCLGAFTAAAGAAAGRTDDRPGPIQSGAPDDFLLQWPKKIKCLVFSTQDLDIVEEIATPRHCHGDGAQRHGGWAAGGFSLQPRFPGSDESGARTLPSA